MARRKQQTIDDANRPRVHPDVHPDADPAVRWATPNPPAHGGDEQLLQVAHDADPELVRGVWINPGEVVRIPRADAKRIDKAS